MNQLRRKKLQVKNYPRTLVELLVSKGILSRREFERMSTMRLHEISKARAFEDLDEEI
jgi:hypothetical protein